MAQKQLQYKNENVELYSDEKKNELDQLTYLLDQNLSIFGDSKLNKLKKQLSKIKNDLGTLLGLCNQDSYRIAVYIGDGLLIEIYEYKKGVKRSFVEIEEYIKKKGSLVGYTPESGLQPITEIVEIHEEIHVYEKMNIVERSKESKNFFSVMRDNFTEMDKLEPGDIVAFDRGLYTHAAVFVDIKRFLVIHKNGEPDASSATRAAIVKTVSGALLDKAVVMKEHLLDIIGTSKIKKYNDYDKKFEPRPKEEIVKHAEKRLNETGYNLTTNNCQHFATECRYGKEFSPEVNSVVNTVIWTGVALTTAAAVGIYNYWKSDKTTEKEEKKEKKEEKCLK